MSGSAPACERTLLLAEDADTAALTALAARSGWALDHLEPFQHGGMTQRAWVVNTPSGAPSEARSEDPSRRPGEEEKATGSGHDTLVRELEHHAHGTRFVSVSGDDADTVAELARTVADTVPTVPLDTVLDDLLAEDTAPRALLRGLRLLTSAYLVSGVTGTAPHTPVGPRHRAAVQRLLRHPERQVRLSTMLRVNTLQHLDAELRRLVIARKDAEEETGLGYVIDAFVKYEAETAASSG